MKNLSQQGKNKYYTGCNNCSFFQNIQDFDINTITSKRTIMIFNDIISLNLSSKKNGLLIYRLGANIFVDKTIVCIVIR